jgi:hypothetical protein
MGTDTQLDFGDFDLASLAGGLAAGCSSITRMLSMLLANH